MAEPLDVVTAIEKARHIVEQPGGAEVSKTIAILAGHMIVAEELRHLTTAVGKLEEAVKHGLYGV